MQHSDQTENVAPRNKTHLILLLMFLYKHKCKLGVIFRFEYLMTFKKHNII